MTTAHNPPATQTRPPFHEGDLILLSSFGLRAWIATVDLNGDPRRCRVKLPNQTVTMIVPVSELQPLDGKYTRPADD